MVIHCCVLFNIFFFNILLNLTILWIIINVLFLFFFFLFWLYLFILLNHIGRLFNGIFISHSTEFPYITVALISPCSLFFPCLVLFLFFFLSKSNSLLLLLLFLLLLLLLLLFLLLLLLYEWVIRIDLWLHYFFFYQFLLC